MFIFLVIQFCYEGIDLQCRNLKWKTKSNGLRGTGLGHVLFLRVVSAGYTVSPDPQRPLTAETQTVVKCMARRRHPSFTVGSVPGIGPGSHCAASYFMA